MKRMTKSKMTMTISQPNRIMERQVGAALRYFDTSNTFRLGIFFEYFSMFVHRSKHTSNQCTVPWMWCLASMCRYRFARIFAQ